MRNAESGGVGAALLCSAAAAALSAPALAFPFLSDDWALLAAVSEGPALRTPFGDFRPLLMASLWIDRTIWGLSPVGFHLTQIALIALATGLVVLLLRRSPAGTPLAIPAGLLFALHPYHVETAAWIGSRADPLFAVFFLLTLLAFERWRRRAQGIPIGALFLFEASLLSKEPAIVMPLFLTAAQMLDSAQRSRREIWLRGVLPFAITGAAHFGLRWVVLGGPGRTLLGGSFSAKVDAALGFAAASVLPLDPGCLADRPLLWGISATLIALVLVGLSVRHVGRVPRAAIAGAILFAILLLPHVVGFQRRYFFLPAAASAVLVAALLLQAGRRTAVLTLGILLAAGWMASGVDQWWRWRQAAIASEGLISDLVAMSARPEVSEILVTNMPLRIAGASVGGDMQAALSLSGQRPVPVHAACWISYAAADAGALAGTPEEAIVTNPHSVEVRLRLNEGPFAHLAGPRPPRGGAELPIAGGTLAFDGPSTLRVRLHGGQEAGRAVVSWTGGRLIPVSLP